MKKVLICLGSNIDPVNNLKRAMQIMREYWPDMCFSSVYRTAPREVQDQPDFLNAVGVFETAQSAEEVHNVLQAIERELKKSVHKRYGPRTIDLDLLLFGDSFIETEGLTVPHPRMHERRFVLEPLCELIDAQLKHPGIGKTWKDLFRNVMDQKCQKTEMNV